MLWEEATLLIFAQLPDGAHPCHVSVIQGSGFRKCSCVTILLHLTSPAVQCWLSANHDPALPSIDVTGAAYPSTPAHPEPENSISFSCRFQFESLVPPAFRAGIKHSKFHALKISCPSIFCPTPQILKNIKSCVEVRNSVCYGATILAHSLMQAGTTNDLFLRQNLDWLERASNWGKFSATAGLGVIYSGQLTQVSVLGLGINLNRQLISLAILPLLRWQLGQASPANTPFYQLVTEMHRGLLECGHAPTPARSASAAAAQCPMVLSCLMPFK